MHCFPDNFNIIINILIQGNAVEHESGSDPREPGACRVLDVFPRGILNPKDR